MTEQRPIQPTPVGALRFNTDSAKLEYFDGYQYVNITTDSPEQNTGANRGLFAGGRSPTYRNRIDFINLDSTGNATDFGNLTLARVATGSCASRTRGMIGGGYEPSPELYVDKIEFITISSTGDAVDFGDISGTLRFASGTSDSHGGLE